MSVVSVKARSFILALFIRDDGERFLLGDKGFDFKDSQLHFAANTIENDEVQKQGADGVMLAGQVRRASVQTFDGYVGDGTTSKDKIEEMRREFIAFFAKDHHFRVIYVDCNRNAWQRKGGYLVDAPEVKELWQVHPEYHVGLNFEDVNYYDYDENAEGVEIPSNILSVPISSVVEGGLVWDGDGAVSEDATIEYDCETAEAGGTDIALSDAVEAPLYSFAFEGNTEQDGTPTPSSPVPVKVVTGENVVKIYQPYQEQSYPISLGSTELCGLGDDGAGGFLYQDSIYKNLSDGKWYVHKEVGSYTFDGTEGWIRSGSTSTTVFVGALANSSLTNLVLASLGAAPMSLSDRFTYGSSSTIIGTFSFYNDLGGVAQAMALRVDITTIPDLASFKTWLGSNPTTVCYPLATPTDTEITNQTLIAQLEAVLDGNTYEGTTNITTAISAGNAQGELEIGYYTRYRAVIIAGGYVWDEGGSGGPTIVVNDSISAVSPIWTVHGPALNPQLENATNGDAIEYVGMVADGQTLVIDMGEQTAKLDGLNVISNVVGDFISLEPGTNTLLYSASNGAPESEIGWSEIVG